MAFSLKSFLAGLEKVIEAAPLAIEEAFAIKGEAQSGASETQLAQDSLHAATGIAEGLLSDNPAEQADAATASAVTASILNAVSSVNAAEGTGSVLPTPAVPAVPTPAAPAPPEAVGTEAAAEGATS
jgi:hypothetical protein